MTIELPSPSSLEQKKRGDDNRAIVTFFVATQQKTKTKPEPKQKKATTTKLSSPSLF
jgi:hypothetical protein